MYLSDIIFFFDSSLTNLKILFLTNLLESNVALSLLFIPLEKKYFSSKIPFGV